MEHLPGRTAAEPADARLRGVLLRLAVALAAGALAWFVAVALWQVALLVGALLAALLLTALMDPASSLLRRWGLPAWAAAGLTTLALLGGLAAVALLVYSRAAAQLSGVGSLLTTALDDLRRWLVGGPLQLDPARVDELRDTVVAQVQQAAPGAVAGAMTALNLLSGAVLAVFAVFFLLKDGRDMWRWVLRWAPARTRGRVEDAGAAAWDALSGYVRGIVVVAAVDAVAIGTALLLLGVPVWLSLTLLTFLGAFVPVLGATVAGGAAVVVTLVTDGARDAVIVLVVVVVVQQLEGNVLHPLIVGKALRLHPLAILGAVTAGVLVLGVVGALIAVPLTAVTYRVAAALRQPPDDVPSRASSPDDRTDGHSDDSAEAHAGSRTEPRTEPRAAGLRAR